MTDHTRLELRAGAAETSDWRVFTGNIDSREIRLFVARGAYAAMLMRSFPVETGSGRLDDVTAWIRATAIRKLDDGAQDDLGNIYIRIDDVPKRLGG